ncbi:MAG: TadE/TadG family type IV pilus assembly protein [Terriglobales bacterium]
MLTLTRSAAAQRLRSLLADTGASQIAEFAVALPLLLVMVVGIFDFGNAYNLKQKVTNAAREAAHMGAGQPTSDLSNAPPPSVLAIRDLVVSSLQSGKVNDCGLGSAVAVAAGAATPWKWRFTVSCGTAGNLVLSVDRGYVVTSSVTVSGTPVKMIATSVTLRYPYQWQFNRIITLVVPTAIYPGTTQILVGSTMTNQS